MMVSRQAKELDKPYHQSDSPITPRQSIYSIRRISRLFRIKHEGFMTLFAITDHFYIMNKPITVSGVCKALNIDDGNYNSIYRMTETLVRKGLVEVVSMGNVHKYYIPTDKALEQISPLLR